MHKLSRLDAKILGNLLYDGRKGFAEIAEACNETKNKVWKHYKVLQKNGIITGATIQINFSSFGYDTLATLLINVEAQQITQFMEYMRNIVEVRAYRQYNNVYNVRAFATLKEITDLDHVKQAIKRRIPIIGLKTYLWTDVRNIPENMSFTRALYPNESYEYESKVKIHPPMGKIGMDDLDIQIANKLAINGRTSFTEIAKDAGVSTDTIVKRYHKLIRNKAMKVSIQINPKKIGYNAILDLNIAFSSPGNLSGTVVEALAKIPDVIIITKTSGDYDLQLTAMVRDIEHSFTIEEQIASVPGITKIETSARKIPKKWPTPRQYLSTF